VAAERYLAGQLAEERFGCTVHLLDDGFQHVQLARDIDLVVVTRADLDERVLPSGRLREPLEAAAGADALLVGADEDTAAIGDRLGVDTIFRIARRYESPRLVQPFGDPLPPSTGQRVVAVAGIARPERFFAALRGGGWDVATELVFRDHHRAALDAHADLVVTTEKDAVRLHLVAGGAPIWAYLPLQVEIEPAADFGAWLSDRVAAARRRRGVAAA
jgi:tetraacyldisaccharide 4'-kinase